MVVASIGVAVASLVIARVIASTVPSMPSPRGRLLDVVSSIVVVCSGKRAETVRATRGRPPSVSSTCPEAPMHVRTTPSSDDTFREEALPRLERRGLLSWERALRRTGSGSARSAPAAARPASWSTLRSSPPTRPEVSSSLACESSSPTRTRSCATKPQEALLPRVRAGARASARRDSLDRTAIRSAAACPRSVSGDHARPSRHPRARSAVDLLPAVRASPVAAATGRARR